MTFTQTDSAAVMMQSILYILQWVPRPLECRKGWPCARMQLILLYSWFLCHAPEKGCTFAITWSSTKKKNLRRIRMCVACRGRKTISEKISAYSKEVLWEKSSSDGDEPASKRIAKTDDGETRLPLKVAIHNGTTSQTGSRSGLHGLGQLPLCTSPRNSRRPETASVRTSATGAARSRSAHVQEPQTAPLQGPDGLQGPLQDAANQTMGGGHPLAAAQDSVEVLPLTSPPAAEHAHQLAMVPDTPVSDGVRDSAPDVQPWEVPSGTAHKAHAPASHGVPLIIPDGISVGDKERSNGPQQSWTALGPQSPVLQPAAGKTDVMLPFAPGDADDCQQWDAPQLMLDLHMSGTQSMGCETKGLQSSPGLAPVATPNPHRAAAEALAAAGPGALPAAAVAQDDPVSGCLKQSADRETPLVQCAQLAADLSTGDSSRRALAVRSALGAAQKVRLLHKQFMRRGFLFPEHVPLPLAGNVTPKQTAPQ